VTPKPNPDLHLGVGQDMTRLATYAAALLALPVIAMATPAEAAPATCDGLTATMVGTDGDDTLAGTAGPDVIAGLGGNDRVEGLGGADRLCGDSGADVLVADRDDVVDPGTSGMMVDTIDYSTSATGLLIDLRDGFVGSFVEPTGRVVVTEQVSLVGTPHDDVILGSDFDDLIQPGLGADIVSARGGDDVVTDADMAMDDPDADRYYGEQGDDVLDGGWGADRLNGGIEADTLIEDDGSSVCNGGPGRDLITMSIRVATPVGQTVTGGGGVDTLVIRHVWELGFTLGRPVGLVNLRASLVKVETRGPTTTSMRARTIENVQVYDGHWTLIGDGRDNVLEGGSTRSSNVDIRAGGGDDVLRGTRHDNVLDGGRGFDRAFRTAGHDRYVSVERIR
jgi:Ca2+-binding RTX toxin-like protein